MCRCRDAELNCVNKYTRRSPELMQLEIGMSTIRYLPARGTAGLARSLVNGNNRVPCPPPMMTESTLLVLIESRPVRDINGFLLRNYFRLIRWEQSGGKGYRQSAFVIFYFRFSISNPLSAIGCPLFP